MEVTTIEDSILPFEEQIINTQEKIQILKIQHLDDMKQLREDNIGLRTPLENKIEEVEDKT